MVVTGTSDPYDTSCAGTGVDRPSLKEGYFRFGFGLPSISAVNRWSLGSGASYKDDKSKHLKGETLALWFSNIIANGS